MTTHRDGLLIVDKSAGMTSFDVVRRVRKLANTRKVGHAGTLDPDATGVLPVAIGRCTKLLRFLTIDEKYYGFEMHLGEETDTADSSGEVVRQAGWENLSRDDLEEVLPRFLGRIDQVPPVYSAIKVDGKRAYELARKGEDVVLEPRPVEILQVEVDAWNPPVVEMKVRCGPSTYIRALARDLGRALDSAAHAAKIRRLAVGPFSLGDAVSLEGLEGQQLDSWLLSPMEMVQSLPTYRLDAESRRRVGHGQFLTVQRDWEVGDYVAARDVDGNLVAVMECIEADGETAQLRPRRVMISEP